MDACSAPGADVPAREHVNGPRTPVSTSQCQCAPMPGTCETSSRLRRLVAGPCYHWPGGREAGSRCVRADPGDVPRKLKVLPTDAGTVRERSRCVCRCRDQARKVAELWLPTAKANALQRGRAHLSAEGIDEQYEPPSATTSRTIPTRVGRTRQTACAESPLTDTSIRLLLPQHQLVTTIE